MTGKEFLTALMMLPFIAYVNIHNNIEVSDIIMAQPIRTAYRPEDDGITHINVYSRGKTELGQQLSHFAYSPFTHPELGFFTSVEGLWYFLKTRDDRLRDLYGFDAKVLGKQLPVVPKMREEDFHRFINLGNEAKLRQHPAILAELGRSRLSLTHYYTAGGYITQPKDSEWILAHLERIRLELDPQADASNLAFLARQSQQVIEDPQQSLF